MNAPPDKSKEGGDLQSGYFAYSLKNNLIEVYLCDHGITRIEPVQIRHKHRSLTVESLEKNKLSAISPVSFTAHSLAEYPIRVG